MSTITLYHFEGGPACGNANEWIRELQAGKPELSRAKVTDFSIA